jgi:hypothetical protein
MPLPIIDIPTFKCTQPSTGRELKFRPFLVKEEKVLLFALESGDEADISAAIENLITGCVEELESIDELTSYDIEYLFLQIRGKSVNNIIEVNMTHEGCDNRTAVEIDIDEIKVDNLDRKDYVMLSDTLGVKFKNLNHSLLRKISDVGGTDSSKFFNLLYNSVETVFDGDEVYDDFTLEEIKDFIERFTNERFETLVNHFNNMPTLTHMVKYKCSCGKEVETKLSGLRDFFS